MKPKVPDETAEAYWSDLDPVRVKFGAPEGMADCDPCPALVTTDTTGRASVVRVAWELDEIELAQLARGGTLWLSVWGGLPPHMLEVQPPPESRSTGETPAGRCPACGDEHDWSEREVDFMGAPTSMIVCDRVPPGIIHAIDPSMVRVAPVGVENLP